VGRLHQDHELSPGVKELLGPCHCELFNLREDPHEVRNLAHTRPDVVRKMDARLRQIVDYQGVDARAKAYDRRAFLQWRREQLAAGTYEWTMARIYSGWDGLGDDEVQPWTEEGEALIASWLGDIG
jgi:hypothetical protein